MKDIYDVQTYALKTRVYIWMKMDVVTVEYGTFAHTFHLIMCFFQFINGIAFKCDYALWCLIDMMHWIGLRTKFSIYEVPPDPVKWSCPGFGYLWRALILSWMLWYNNYL